MSAPGPVVVDNPERNRYEVAVGDEVAFLAYRRREDHIVLIHTEVPESLRGQGLGQLLARHALDEARRVNAQVIVKCPFVTTWLKRHPEYDSLVIGRVPEDQPPRGPR